MRIKINDKIYRLKEIESGADSLVELVEEPQYKDGDFVVSKSGSVLIFKKKVKDSIYDHAFFNNVLGFSILQETPSYSPIMRHANEEEKERLIDALARKGKKWNAEKLCIEDIPENPKKGDLSIFWDRDKKFAIIRIYDLSGGDGNLWHRDKQGFTWDNAIKFESKEQYERFINHKI